MKVRMVFVIFVVAILARMMYLHQMKDTFLFYHPIVDSGAYDVNSAKMAREAIPKGVFFNFHKVPFYKVFLASVYRALGHNVFLARMIQALINAFCCCLIFLLGVSVFGRRVGLISGLIASVYWPFIAFSNKFLPVNLAVFFILLSVMALSKFINSGKKSWILGSGLFLAFASLARGNTLLIFPGIFIWLIILYNKKKDLKKGVLFGCIFVLGGALVLLPSALNDLRDNKNIMPIQKNYGLAAYQGLSLEHLNIIKPGYADVKMERMLKSKGITSQSARNQYWLSETIEYIKKDPLRYLLSFPGKVYILLNAYEFSPREGINYFRKGSSFLSLPLLNLGHIAAFALFGMFCAIQKGREELKPLYVFLGVYFISLLPFVPLARFRLPMIPFLIVFSAFSISEISECIKVKKWPQLLKYSLFILPLLIITNVNPWKDYLEEFSHFEYHRGLMYLKTGKAEKALSDFATVLEKHPKDADTFEALGDLYTALGDYGKAEAYYLKAFQVEPQFFEVMQKLEKLYTKMGDHTKAGYIREKYNSSLNSLQPMTPNN